MPFVNDIYLHLAFNKDSTQTKLDAQRFFVDGFQQPRAQDAVNLNCRADDRFRQRITHG